jgi:hypothetical protein
MSSGGIIEFQECRGGAIIDPRSELSILERHEYDKGLRQIFNLLTIRGDYQVIGSGAIEEIKYGSDYDLQEFVKESDYQKSTTHLLEMFRQKFREAEADPDVFILDFKAGVDDNGDPIRWDKKSIKAGHKKVDGRKVTFQEALLMKSTIKMDITALIDGVFIEFSNNYYLTLRDFNTFTAVAKSHEDILYSLQHEALTKYNHGDFWKASKRIFAFMKSKGGYVRDIKKLVDFFNTDTGRLSKNRSELDIIALIVDNKFRKPKKIDVVRNLRIVETDIAKLHGYKLNDIHAKINAIVKISNVVKMKEPIEELSAYLKSEVNKTTKEFLDNHNQITKLIVNPFQIKKIKGGSKNSGFIQRLIAESEGHEDTRDDKRPKLKSKINIAKMATNENPESPSQWLKEHYPAKKKGRPVKHATAEAKYQAKLLSNKLKRQEKRQKAKEAKESTAELEGSGSGGSRSSGFVQKMIASKTVDIKKIENPSAWLQDKYPAKKARKKKDNIELVIEEEPTKEELMKELAKRLSKPSFVPADPPKKLKPVASQTKRTTKMGLNDFADDEEAKEPTREELLKDLAKRLSKPSFVPAKPEKIKPVAKQRKRTTKRGLNDFADDDL